MFGSVLWVPNFVRFWVTRFFFGFGKRRYLSPYCPPWGKAYIDFGYGRRGGYMWFSRWSLLMKCDFVSTIMPNKQQGRGYYILREKNTVIVENDII